MLLSRVAGYVLIFLLIRAMVRPGVQRIWVAVAPLIAIGGLEAALGLLQRFTGAESVAGTLLNKDHFAGLLEMILPFAIMYAAAVFYRGSEQGGLSSGSAVGASAIAVVAAAMFIAIMFSLSRMGFLSTLGSLFIMGAVVIGPRLSGRKRWAVLAALASLIVLVFIFFPSRELIQGFGELGHEDTLTVGRLPIWKDTLHLIAAYPLFGCGMGSYFYAFLKYETSGLNVGWVYAHNDYLQLLAELGIVGFLIPAALMIAVASRAVQAAIFSPVREVRFLGLACTGALGAILIHSFADFNLYITANAMVLWWIAAVAAGLPAPVGKQRPASAKQKQCLPPKIVFALGSVLTLYAGTWLIFLHLFDADPRTERAFCRFGICDTGAMLAIGKLVHSTTSAAALPPAELLHFVERDPAAPYRWCDLGEALQREGRTAMARYCFSRTLALGPNIPDPLFRVSRFHFDLGENKHALEMMSRVLESSTIFDVTAFAIYTEKKIPLDDVLRHGLRDRRSYREYLFYLLRIGQTEYAQKTWSWILTHGYSDLELANRYMDYLASKKNPEAAVQAWADYNNGGDKGYPESNRVFNGDFELDPVKSPFDWTFETTSGVRADIDRETHYSGARSLRIRFDGTQNLSNTGVHQTVFLKPGRYSFRAYVLTQDISTDEGVSFSVADKESSKRLSFTTPPVLGTSGWKPIEHEFTVPPGTGLVEVRLIRKQSLKFDNLLGGTMWVDQVSIRPERVNRVEVVNPTSSFTPPS